MKEIITEDQLTISEYKIMFIPENKKECCNIECIECLLIDTVHCNNILNYII